MLHKKLTLIAPFLLVCYFLLSLYVGNRAEVELGDIVLPLIIGMGVVGLSLVVFRLVLRSWESSSILTWFLVLIFFNYGSWKRDILGNFGELTSTLIITFIYLTALPVLVVLLKVLKRFLHPLSLLLLVFSAVLFITPVFQISSSPIPVYQAEEPIKVTLPTKSPDIYLIILDEYAREDTLKSYWNFDNKGFYSYLESRGFYVASRSRCNYDWTVISMSSSLNLRYLQSNELTQGALPYNKVPNNLVGSTLKSVGYRYIWIADEFYSGTGRYAELRTLAFTGYTSFLMQSTALQPIGYDLNPRGRQTVYCFEQASLVPLIKEPTFTVIHTTCPHAPYLFNRDGTREPPKPIHDAYLDQLIWITGKTEALIDTILVQEPNSIIILQSDTGPGPYINIKDKKEYQEERGKILNSYYFPDGNYSKLYQSITPVNSFRLVLDQYFGANLGLLEDKSYMGVLDK